MSPEVKGTVLIPSLFALASCTHAVEMLVVSEACCEVFGIFFIFLRPGSLKPFLRHSELQELFALMAKHSVRNERNSCPVFQREK